MAKPREASRDSVLGEVPRWLRIMTNEQRAMLPELLWEYFLESNHNSWDGHNRRDLAAYARLLSDIMLFTNNHHKWPVGHRYNTEGSECYWEDPTNEPTEDAPGGAGTDVPGAQ